MKELTIEQKAQRYDGNYKVYTELINRLEGVKDAIKKQNYGIAMDILCKPYPEFQITISIELKEGKESEDDVIIKDMIETIKKEAKDFPSSVIAEKSKSWIAWLEKQCEQKPTDKVEPKFHEGEWLCENEPNNYARFIQILEIVNVQGKEVYRISRDTHNDEDIVEFNFVERYYHKFGIQDAKAGDVLADGNDIVIFKENNYNPKDKSGCMFVYCSCNNFYEIGGINPTDYKPATKEQCDTLKKAMTNAGYTFDFEKKELKKIEQKSNIQINPSEYINDMGGNGCYLKKVAQKA